MSDITQNDALVALCFVVFTLIIFSVVYMFWYCSYDAVKRKREKRKSINGK